MNKILLSIFNIFLDLQFLFVFSLFFTDYSFIAGKGVTTLSAPAIIFLILLFLRRLLNRETFDQLLVVKTYKYIFGFADKKILFFTAGSFVTIFIFLGILKHLSFNTSGIDMGGMDNALWNLSHGNSFVSSIEGNADYFGIHFWPIAYFITPFYIFWPNGIILIFIQSLAAGLALLAVYLICKKRLNDRILVFSFIFAYFVCGPLRGIISNDFHTDSFLIPLSLFAYYFLTERKNLAAYICLFLIALCKENAAFILAGFGAFLLFARRQYIFGSLVFIFAIVWWSAVTNYLIPYFANSQAYWGLTWLPYGKTYGENIAALLQNPNLLFNLFFAPEKLGFYLKILGPFGYLSLASPAHFVLILAPLVPLVIGAAAKGSMVVHSAHYQAHTIPFIIIASIYGAGRILSLADKLLKKSNHRQHVVFLSFFIVILALAFHGKSDGHRLAKALRSIKEREAPKILSYLKVIPAEASVCAVNRLVPHLSNRKYIYIWERRNEIPCKAQYVVLYDRLLESDNGQLVSILASLQKDGYRPVVSDKIREFYIFARI